MPKIKVNDINIYYEKFGQGEPLLMISGFSADHAAWLPVIDGLSSRFEVIVFDNRGAGQTDVPDGPYNIKQMADDAKQLCHALGIDSAHVVGNSMGGYIAQTLAHQHPEFVRKLIICNSVMKTNRAFGLYAEAQYELRKANAPMRAIAKAAFSWCYSPKFLSEPGRVDEMLDLAMNYPHQFTNKGYQAQSAALTEFDSTEWVGEISMPTLVIAGDHDLIFQPKDMQQLANTIANAQYHEFQDVGHLPFIEQPKEFVDLLKTWC